MFEVGELVLYGRTGVCRVAEIVEKTLPGEKTPQLFYNLQPLYQSCSISIGVANTKVFIRPIISAEEAKALISSLPGLQAEPYHNRNLNQLREHYRACIETYCCADLAALAKSIWLKRRDCEANKRKLGAVDERFLREAEELLFGELAAALGMEKAQMVPYIKSIIG